MRIRLEFVRDKKLRDQLIDGIDEIDKLTTDALEAARGEASSGDVKTVDLVSLGSAICVEQRELDRTVPLAANQEVTVSGRIGELRRAIRNLIENAIVHGGGAAVEIRQDGEFAVVEVSDTGPGIREPELTRMLKPFAQLDDARSWSRRGAGLGLTITHTIAERHHGSLTLTNRPTGGLTAIIMIPIAGARPNGPIQSGHLRHKLQRRWH